MNYIHCRVSVENIVGSSADDDTMDDDKKGKKKRKKAESRGPSDHGDRFNALLKLCIARLPAALGKLLGDKKSLKSSKNWSKLNKHLKAYTGDLIKVTASVASSESVISALLKHIHELADIFAALPKAAKALLKTLVGLWSTHKDDKVRVLAYMCVLKLGNIKKNQTGE